jgi:hypothetical protein
LSDEHAVEGVSVNRRQAAQRHGMGARHWKLCILVVEKASTKRTDVDAKIVAASPRLDRNLPQARRAERQLIVRLSNQSTGGGGQPPALGNGPKQNSRVEQEPHSSP